VPLAQQQQQQQRQQQQQEDSNARQVCAEGCVGPKPWGVCGGGVWGLSCGVSLLSIEAQVVGYVRGVCMRVCVCQSC
jgi:transcription initiation factor TFIID subunit TAF12